MDSPDPMVPSASSILKKNKEKIARENHSEIERRRRNKMNHYIRELSSIIPRIGNQKKVDKLTILKTTVQYIRLLRDHSEPPSMANNNSSNFDPSPHNDQTSVDSNISFLTSREFRQVLMESANGFMFVYSTATNRILYVSDVVGIILGYKKETLEGKNILDYIHNEDHYKLNANLLKMNDQLDSDSVLGNTIETNFMETSTTAAQDYFPRSDITLRFECGNCGDDYFGLDSIYPSALCANVRRFCYSHRFKDTNNTSTLKDYIVAHCCTSLMKFRDVGFNMTPQHTHLYEGETPDTLCVVAIGYIPPNVVSSTVTHNDSEDTLKQPSDSKLIFQLDRCGKILYIQKPTHPKWYDKFVDAEELHEKSVYGLIHESDQSVFGGSFRKVLETYKRNNNVTAIVKLQIADSLIRTFVTFDVIANAYNDNIECILMECDDMQEQNTTPTFQPSYVGQPHKRSVDLPTTSPDNNICNENPLPYRISKNTNATPYASTATATPTPVSTATTNSNNIGRDFYLWPEIQSIPYIPNHPLSQSAGGNLGGNCGLNSIPQCNSQQLTKSMDVTFPDGSISTSNTKDDSGRHTNSSLNYPPPAPNPLGYIWNVLNVNESNNDPRSIPPFLPMNDISATTGMIESNQVLNFPDPSILLRGQSTEILQSDQKIVNTHEFSDITPNLDNSALRYAPTIPNPNDPAFTYLNQYYNVDNQNNTTPSDIQNNELFSMLFRGGYNPNFGNQHHHNQ